MVVTKIWLWALSTASILEIVCLPLYGLLKGQQVVRATVNGFNVLKVSDGRLEVTLVKEEYFHYESSNNSMLYIKRKLFYSLCIDIFKSDG